MVSREEGLDDGMDMMRLTKDRGPSCWKMHWLGTDRLARSGSGALWQHRGALRRQAAALERATEHLAGLADILHAAGRPEAASRLMGIALRFRVKAICLGATAEARIWRTGDGTTAAIRWPC
jgi:hypothetical protein